MVTNLLPRTVALVNSVLMLSADTPLPAADLARAAGVAYTPALSALTTLENAAWSAARAGQAATSSSLTKESLHYPMAYATALVDLPLGDALQGQHGLGIYAYGSLAQPGGGTRSSDLDLLIIGDVKDRAGLSERLAIVGERLNRVIDPFILTPEQFEHAKQRRDRHVASALSGVRVMGSV